MGSSKILVDFQETPLEPFVLKEIGLNDAVEIAATQTMQCSLTRRANPLWKLIMRLTGKCVAFSKAQRRADQNCMKLRTVIADYVKKRKSG